MHIFLIITLFILGTIFGSFYNVVGYRIPKRMSILYPPSHCTKCNKQLRTFELIPIISYICLGGKCKKCKNRISFFYPIFEFLTGVAFSISYIIFGWSLECIYSIVFLSMLIILIISDYQTMIIPDSILIVFSLILASIKTFITGIESVGISFIHAGLSFLFMFFLKMLGDFLFKKESMGGGDIKLLAVFGFVLGFPMATMSVFLSAFIALPISLILLKINKSHEIPFGPFLAMSAIIIFLTRIDINWVIEILTIS